MKTLALFLCRGATAFRTKNRNRPPPDSPSPVLPILIYAIRQETGELQEVVLNSNCVVILISRI